MLHAVVFIALVVSALVLVALIVALLVRDHGRARSGRDAPRRGDWDLAGSGPLGQVFTPELLGRAYGGRLRAAVRAGA